MIGQRLRFHLFNQSAPRVRRFQIFVVPYQIGLSQTPFCVAAWPRVLPQSHRLRASGKPRKIKAAAAAVSCKLTYSSIIVWSLVLCDRGLYSGDEQTPAILGGWRTT